IALSVAQLVAGQVPLGPEALGVSEPLWLREASGNRGREQHSPAFRGSFEFPAPSRAHLKHATPAAVVFYVSPGGDLRDRRYHRGCCRISHRKIAGTSLWRGRTQPRARRKYHGGS